MAFDCFINIDGIPGESTDDKHQGWIEVLSYSTGAMQPASGSRSSGGARSAGRVDMEDFIITKQLDKATPKLALHCCNGRHIPEIIVAICNATEKKEEYMRYTMNDCIITSVNTTGSGSSSEVPTEDIAINFDKITWKYTELDHKTGASKGALESNWSTTANTGG